MNIFYVQDLMKSNAPKLQTDKLMPTKKHHISIVLLTHNRCAAGYLKVALDAILKQTYSDFELLVVDNYSTDDTAQLVLSYDDSRLCYIRQPPGGNATTSYNHAMWMSRGDYILFTHDDDIMAPEMIERQMGFINQHPDILCCATNVGLIDEKGEPIQSSLYDLDQNFYFQKAAYIKKYFEEKLWLPTPTMLYHRDSYFELLKPWLKQKKPDYFASGDIWAALTLNLKGAIGLLAKPLLNYRQHRKQESRNVDQESPVIKAIQLFLENNTSNKQLEPLLPMIHAYLVRFETQKSLFNLNNLEKLSTALKTASEYWTTNVVSKKRAVDTILPFEIARMLSGNTRTIPEESFAELLKQAAYSGARQSYRTWLNKVYNGLSLFQQLHKIEKIAIFGSMLNAHLLVLDAARTNIQIIACFDSSPARIGHQVLDVPIIPLEKIPEYTNNFQLLILSNEYDQEDAIKHIIKKHLTNLAAPQIISWKDLTVM